MWIGAPRLANFPHLGYIATVGKEALVWRCQDGKTAEGRFCHLMAPGRLLIMTIRKHDDYLKSFRVRRGRRRRRCAEW